MSLAKFAMQYGPEVAQYIKNNRRNLLAGAGGAAALGTGAALGAPYIDEYMTDQAIDSVIRDAKRGISNAIDFAEENPGTATAALGLAGLIGEAGGPSAALGLIADEGKQFFNPQRRRKR